MLTALFYYWLIGVLFTGFCLYAFQEQGVTASLYNDFLKDCEEDEELEGFTLSYSTFEIIFWIVNFIVTPLIYPAILMYWFRK